jgi:hypothetical protein
MKFVKTHVVRINRNFSTSRKGSARITPTSPTFKFYTFDKDGEYHDSKPFNRPLSAKRVSLDKSRIDLKSVEGADSDEMGMSIGKPKITSQARETDPDYFTKRGIAAPWTGVPKRRHEEEATKDEYTSHIISPREVLLLIIR